MKILVTDQLHTEGISYIKSQGIEVDERLDLTGEDLKRIIGDYEGLIVRSRTKVTKEVIEAGKKLLVVGRAGVGLDNVDTTFAIARNIKVLNTPNVSTTSVAELVIGYMISAVRHIPQATVSIQAGQWEKEKFFGTELAEKTLGIVGLGRIGNAVAIRARAFEMKIIGFDPFVANSEYVKVVDLDTLVRESDFITVHVPLTENTHHMISSREVKKMKRGVVLINAARGGILDEDAIDQGMKEGIVSSVALDTFESEKPFKTILREL
ncbi:MAG: hydroxyacid dehydrogenase, partial [Candidatus Thermoplasmatota archaeon]|nr:hydroxyacid dehydrogenase [Candidatus Thermoplasmatota archaeon]